MGESDSATEAPQNLLQKILGLPLIGEFLVTAIALVPGLLLFALRAAWLDVPLSTEDEPGGVFLIANAGVTALWLTYLEDEGRVRITLPVIPIPLIWFTPVVAIMGIVKLFN